MVKDVFLLLLIEKKAIAWIVAQLPVDSMVKLGI
jgi:hypothetical protein